MRFALIIAGVLVGTSAAAAAPIANPIATFSGLDKLTARLTNFDVYINETVQFGSLQITPRVCYKRPADEAQRTSVFVEVDQVSLVGSSKRVFTGWMFADSPALNAIDDAVYDFWLVDCRSSSDVPPPDETSAVVATPTAPVAAAATAATAAPPPAAEEPTTAETPALAASGRDERGSFITLLDPRPSAETSPDSQ